MEFEEKKIMALEIVNVLIQNKNVIPVSDGYGNIKFEIDGEKFSYSELCHHFLIEIDEFDAR